MKISEISNEVGLSIDTIRYYEKMGLLKPDKEGHQRDYNDKHIARIKKILLLKNAFFSIREIQYLTKMDDELQSMDDIYNMDNNDLNQLLSLVREKRNTVENKKKDLEKAEVMLEKIQTKLETLERDS